MGLVRHNPQATQATTESPLGRLEGRRRMSDDPWRTQGEYREEQKRARNLYLIAFASLIIAGLGATAQGAGVILTALKPSLVRVECVAPPSSASTERMPRKSPK